MFRKIAHPRPWNQHLPSCRPFQRKMGLISCLVFVRIKKLLTVLYWRKMGGYGRVPITVNTVD